MVMDCVVRSATVERKYIHLVVVWTANAVCLPLTVSFDFFMSAYAVNRALLDGPTHEGACKLFIVAAVWPMLCPQSSLHSNILKPRFLATHREFCTFGNNRKISPVWRDSNTGAHALLPFIPVLWPLDHHLPYVFKLSMYEAFQSCIHHQWAFLFHTNLSSPLNC